MSKFDPKALGSIIAISGEHGVVVDYTRTSALRWVNRQITMTDDKGNATGVKFEKVLQQGWQGSDGSIKWEDVETVS